MVTELLVAILGQLTSARCYANTNTEGVAKVLRGRMLSLVLSWPLLCYLGSNKLNSTVEVKKKKSNKKNKKNQWCI